MSRCKQMITMALLFGLFGNGCSCKQSDCDDEAKHLIAVVVNPSRSLDERLYAVSQLSPLDRLCVSRELELSIPGEFDIHTDETLRLLARTGDLNTWNKLYSIACKSDMPGPLTATFQGAMDVIESRLQKEVPKPQTTKVSGTENGIK